MMDWMVILTGIYVFATIILVYCNIASVKEVKEQRAELNRPIIECYFAVKNDSMAVLRVKNEGNRIGKNIQIRSDEPLFEDGECYGVEEVEKLMNSTFDLAPGEFFDVFLDTTSEMVKIDKKRKFTITYEDEVKEYRNESSINFYEYRWIIPHPPKIILK